MSDAPDGGVPTPEMEPPDGADEDEFAEDEVTEATPPHAEEGEETPEAG